MSRTRAALRTGAVIAFFAIIANGCVTPERYGGPLETRNQHPAQLTVLRMEPTAARTLGEGASRVDLDLSYTSLFLRGTGQNNTFVMDGEILRVGLGAKYGITDAWQLDFAIPLAHTSGGFLDHFVEEWHRALNTPNSGRQNYAEGIYDIEATRNGATVYRMSERKAELMDVPIGLTWQLLQPTEESPFALAVRGAVEAPTGDQAAGFGNGGWDYSVGLVGEVLLGPFSLTAHAEHTFAHTPDRARAAGVDFGDVTSAGIAVEAAITQDTAFHVGLETDTSVLRGLRGVNTDKDQDMLWVGFRSYMSEEFAVEIGFGEDMSREVGPDFTAYLGFRLDVGPGQK